MSDFIFAGGADAAVPKNACVKKYQTQDLAFVCKAPIYGGVIYGLAVDTDYVYAGGSTVPGQPPAALKKYHQSNLALLATAPSYGGVIHAVTGSLDPDYVYAGGETASVIRKYRKADLSLVLSSANLGGTIYALDEDDEFIYAGGSRIGGRIRKFKKSDLTPVGTFPSCTGAIYGLANDTDFIYAANCANRQITKYRKSDHALVATSPVYGYSVFAVTVKDDNYVFAAGNASHYEDRTPKKYAKSNLAYICKGPPNRGELYAITEDTDFVYAPGTIGTDSPARRIKKHQKSDLAVVITSPDYGGDICGLALGLIVTPPSNWDFSSAQWQLDSTTYTSPPTSWAGIDPTPPVSALCRVPGTLDLVEGRIITQRRRLASGGTLHGLLFGNQAPLDQANYDNTYLVYQPPDKTYVKLQKYAGAVAQTLGVWQIDELEDWHRVRLSWWKAKDPAGNDILAVKFEQEEAGAWEGLGILYDPDPPWLQSGVNRCGLIIHGGYPRFDDTEIYAISS